MEKDIFLVTTGRDQNPKSRESIVEVAAANKKKNSVTVILLLKILLIVLKMN